MTTPTIFASGYDAYSLQSAPQRKDGAAKHVRTVATIPAATAINTVVGLLPFNKGMKLAPYASSVLCGDADTGSTATIDIGWVYDLNGTYTNDTDGFLAASTAPQTGVAAALTAAAGFAFEAEGDGWIVAIPTGETVEVEYTVKLDAVVSYQ